MSRPLVVVAGSAEAKRTDYKPPIDDCAQAQKAAEQLGGQLAKQGCRILVYSSDPQFIECHIVRGYVETGAKEAHSIQVRFPAGSAAARFPEYSDHADLFDFRADPHKEWEASYYRSIREADGVLLIGGGQSVLITGHIALGYRIPLVAIASFGGGSRKVWESIVPGQDLVTPDERSVMASPHWTESSAADCIRALLQQHQRRAREIAAREIQEREQGKQINRRAIIAGLVFLATLAILPIGLGVVETGSLVFTALLFFSGALAGTSGSTIRMLWSADNTDSTVRTAVLGLVAGGISAVLFILAQVASNPTALGFGDAEAGAGSQPNTLLVFAVVIGFVAGFTFDTVYKKLAKADVAKIEVISDK